ncbi:hypothetical protein H0H93_006817 [Arthromyces matolae]|nr:hypothetical protein H0H93_006817 [Arthromyces matolae]
MEKSLDVVFKPINLPCGRVLNNRLVKVALYEHLADFRGGPPNEHHFQLYSNWAAFGWGMILTGNVQVSRDHIGLGRDIVIPGKLSAESLLPFRHLATSMKGSGEDAPLTIMQLCHCGRQSTNFLGGRSPFKPPLAPSSIPVTSRNSGWLSEFLHALMFQIPKPMSVDDIDDAVEAFITGAKVAFESGFDGIQLHAAHGCEFILRIVDCYSCCLLDLLAQFISPKSNKRTDDYSAESENALRIVHRIASGIRSSTSPNFVIGIKLNAADYASKDDPNAYDRVITHFKSIAKWGLIDFIEVSGGDYEKPAKSNASSDFLSTTNSLRQALFSDFSQAAMDVLESLSLGQSSPLIVLTGGLRTPELLHTALTSNHAHLLGIGRGSVLLPDLPRRIKQHAASGSSDSQWLSPFSEEPKLDSWSRIRRHLPAIPLLSAGIVSAWYNVAMRQLAARPLSISQSQEPAFQADYNIGPVGAIFWMWFWLDDSWRRGLYLALGGILFYLVSSLVMS